jgi:hypothetical protein
MQGVHPKGSRKGVHLKDSRKGVHLKDSRKGVHLKGSRKVIKFLKNYTRNDGPERPFTGLFSPKNKLLSRTPRGSVDLQNRIL